MPKRTDQSPSPETVADTAAPGREGSLEAALMHVSSSGAALVAEIGRLTSVASELSRNRGAATPSTRAAQAATSLHGLQTREAEFEFACLQLQGALMRCGAARGAGRSSADTPRRG